jgi:hypothetical protein
MDNPFWKALARQWLLGDSINGRKELKVNTLHSITQA